MSYARECLRIIERCWWVFDAGRTYIFLFVSSSRRNSCCCCLFGHVISVYALHWWANERWAGLCDVRSYMSRNMVVEVTVWCCGKSIMRARLNINTITSIHAYTHIHCATIYNAAVLSLNRDRLWRVVHIRMMVRRLFGKRRNVLRTTYSCGWKLWALGRVPKQWPHVQTHHIQTPLSYKRRWPGEDGGICMCLCFGAEWVNVCTKCCEKFKLCSHFGWRWRRQSR